MKGCIKCGGENLHRKTILGDPISAKEIGRPKGARGSESPGGQYYLCLDCGTEMDLPVESLREKKRRLWIESLPTKTINIDGDIFHISIRGEVEDRWGNFLFSLPQDPIEDIRDWIKTKIEEIFVE